ncbi:hypothetical protein BH11PSE3_BH11PSE3_18580 [soil metagenome]
MSATAVFAQERGVTRLDFSLLRRGFLIFGVLNLLIAPSVPDPVAYGVAAFVPAVLLTIIARPVMPSGLVFLLIWQWAQVFARVLQGALDGESMSGSVYGADVPRAFWYALASVVTLALAFRVVLGKVPGPTRAEFHAHERWQAPDLIKVYFAAMAASLVFTFVSRLGGGLDQPMGAAAQVKVVALYLLCTYVFTTGKGAGTLLAAITFEIMLGFTGLFSDFRVVFFYVAFSAFAARIRWTGAATMASLVWLAVLVTLALFWTSVKMDYREYVTGGEETQAISVPLGERMAYLGDKALQIGDTKWGETAYMLLTRFAYVDIFGQVIGVAENSKEPTSVRQWKDALAHIFQPRFLFPSKAPLSDTDVYLRLARADPFEQMRMGTSISVGYLAENYVDLGFPGMLVGIFILGTLLALVAKYMMSRPGLPWMLKEGIVMGMAYNVAGTGIEISLPKFLGAMVMFFVVWALIAKFALPIAIRWLDQRVGFVGPRKT